MGPSHAYNHGLTGIRVPGQPRVRSQAEHSVPSPCFFHPRLSFCSAGCRIVHDFSPAGTGSPWQGLSAPASSCCGNKLQLYSLRQHKLPVLPWWSSELGGLGFMFPLFFHPEARGRIHSFALRALKTADSLWLIALS